MDTQVGTIKSSEINGFLADHGIYHAKEVKFTETGYTVVRFRRDEKGEYLLSRDHPGEPIIDEESFTYGN
jgi:hypothetical protein